MTTKEQISQDYSAITTVGSLITPWTKTFDLFDSTHIDSDYSAIDNYIKNTRELNILWVTSNSVSPEFSRLLLLGYVSAVESYLRNLLRNLIHSVKQVQDRAHSQTVPFGAVLYHKKNLLPEALLENSSFSSADEINSAIQKYVGLNIKSDSRFKDHYETYEKICQMRHCCTHRFGKLGAKNAIVFGLQEHSHVLEKPIHLDFDCLTGVASWLMSFTKLLNNCIFQKILNETRNKDTNSFIDWKGTFAKDKKKFEAIYNLFATTLDGYQSPSSEEIYNRFISAQGISKI